MSTNSEQTQFVAKAYNFAKKCQEEVCFTIDQVTVVRNVSHWQQKSDLPYGTEIYIKQNGESKKLIEMSMAENKAIADLYKASGGQIGHMTLE